MKEGEKSTCQAQGTISPCKSPHISWKQSLMGFIMGISGLFILGVILCLFIGQHTKTWAQNSIYIVSDTVGVAKTNGIATCNESKSDVMCRRLFEKLRMQGALMTPDEFASRVTSYYNTLVAVLGVMVAIFTFASYFLVNNFYKNEFDRERLNIKTKLEADVATKIQHTLRDSLEVRRGITAAIRGDIEEDFVRADFADSMVSKVEEIKQKLRDIEVQMADLQEKVPSGWHVLDEESCNSVNNGG